VKDSFDVAIIGAGVSGASIAQRLSAYELSVILLEAEEDISFGVSKANSGIVHAGFHHPPGSLKALLEVSGSLMFDRLSRELDFPFKRCGAIVAAFDEEEMRVVQGLYERGKANGAIGLEILSRDRILEMEGLIRPDVLGGLHAPAGGIVESYRFVFALVESAVANGLELRTNFRLSAARREGDSWVLSSERGEEINARWTVNAAGLRADEVSRILGAEKFTIRARKGQYFILDRLTKARPGKILFPTPSAVSKGMLVIPTVEDTVLLGPSAAWADSKDDADTDASTLDRVMESARALVPSIRTGDVIANFAGLRPVLESWDDDPSIAPLKDDFYIALSFKAPALVQAAGIQSPGLTASPAIGEYVKEILRAAGLPLREKSKYSPGLKRRGRMRGESGEEAEALVASESRFGNIVCRCERVSEAEIVEAIRAGHATLDGVKYFTRAQMGRCQGGFCEYKIIKIIMRETGLPWEGVTKRGGASRILGGEL
jgi:glycerol-3-phosphate dehydrogenase